MFAKEDHAGLEEHMFSDRKCSSIIVFTMDTGHLTHRPLEKLVVILNVLVNVHFLGNCSLVNAP